MGVRVRDHLLQVKTVKTTLALPTVKDTIYLVNGIPMLALESAAPLAENTFLFVGVIEYAKLAAQAWTAGQRVYYDALNDRFTTAATGNTLAGLAQADAGNPSALGLICLSPFYVGTNQLENAIADPGTAKAIPVDASGVVAITTGAGPAAETNTLADPPRIGMTLVLTCDVKGVADRVITAASAINQAGNTIMTFGAAADTIQLYAAQVAGALVWRVGSNDGVALS